MLVGECGKHDLYNGIGSVEILKKIKQNGVTDVNQDGCPSAMTFWFKKEAT